MEGIIYMYTSPSGKSYIGQTWCQKTRTKQHKEARTTSCFHKAIRKYGFESFKYEILHKKIYIQMELDILESSEIENRKTLVLFGYNLMISGRGGLLSEEHKRRIGAGNKGHKMPETTKNILIKANTGRKQTKEHIEKVANKNRGRKRTKEFCEGQSLRALGRKLGPMSEANKQKLRGRKMSEAQKELLIKINTGKKISEEQKEKTRESNRKRIWKNESKQKLIITLSKNVECVETGKIYLNCKIAARENGFKHGSAINKCAQGKVLTSYGFHWRYIK